MMTAKFHKQMGVTLVELMVTIGIVAVMLMIAVPSFQNYTATQRLRSVSADIVSALNIARSEAVKRNANVKLSAKSGGWAKGWQVTTPDPDNPSSTITLMDYAALDRVAFTASGSATSLEYGNDGRLTTAAVSFQVDNDPSVSGVSARCVQVSLSGKPKTDKGDCP